MQASVIQKEDKLKAFLLDFISGGTAGSIAKTVSAPAERVKLLLQTQDNNSKLKQPYTGVFNCFSRVFKEEGLLAFWRGNWANVVRYFPTQAMNFAFKDFFRHTFNPYDHKKEPLKFFFGNILSGGMAGSTACLFLYPLDFLRTRLGVDLGRSKLDREFTGMADCAVKIVKSDGIVGLYRGMNMAIFGIFMYRGLYFGFYDTGKPIFLGDRKDLGIMTKFIYAQSCVLCAELFSYPTDTVKRKLMLQAGKDQVQYAGVIDCFRKTYQTGGFFSFWKGYSSNVFRSLGSSLCLLLYDELKIQQKFL
jgi:Mitochondrial carrier protein.